MVVTSQQMELKIIFYFIYKKIYNNNNNVQFNNILNTFIYLIVCYNIYLLHFWYCMSKSDCVDLWEKENLFNRLNKNDSLAYEVVLALISVLSQWKISLIVW